MSRISVISLLLLLLSFSIAFGLDKGQGARATLLKDKSITDFQTMPRFATAEMCSVRTVGDASWLILNWLVGDEQYLAYQDPGMTCTAPYPFTVTEVYMVIYITQETIIYARGGVESVDLTNPDCPVPGDTLSLSLEYGFQLAPGLWRVAIPSYNDSTDVPPQVNGPYFATFTITTLLAEINLQDSVMLVTEDSLHVPWTCQNYNYYDVADGYVDLGDPNNGFPGKLLLYSAGETGGSGGYGPMPRLSFLEPQTDALASTPLRSWVWDSQNVDFVDSVRFEYSTPTSGWTWFGVDADNNHALRNGVDPSGTGSGYWVDLGPAGLIEDAYRIRVTAFDTLQRTSQTQIDISLDPTPPRMDFIKPTSMETLCLPYVVTTFTDEEDADLLSVKYYQKKMTNDYNVSVATLLQTDYGDTDYFSGDGNPIADGEFGEYYSGPVAGAIAIDYWFDMGYTQLRRELGNTIPLDTVVERLAAKMSTRANTGTYDDFFIGGLQDYITFHGSDLFVESYFTPNYMDLLIVFEEKEMLAILGLSGNPGLYVVLSGMSGLENDGGNYNITISDPITGTLIETIMRNVPGGAQVLYDGSWLGLDIAIALGATVHVNSRVEFGTGTKSASNWVYNWETSSALSDDAFFYLTAIGTDMVHRSEITTTVFNYQCNLNRVRGDFNNDGVSNSMDVLYLINYIYIPGSAIPVGGAHRADTNCDSQIDIGDVIFMVKFIFEGGDLPCY